MCGVLKSGAPGAVFSIISKLYGPWVGLQAKNSHLRRQGDLGFKFPVARPNLPIVSDLVLTVMRGVNNLRFKVAPFRAVFWCEYVWVEVKCSEVQNNCQYTSHLGAALEGASVASSSLRLDLFLRNLDWPYATTQRMLLTSSYGFLVFHVQCWIIIFLRIGTFCTSSFLSQV